MTTPILLAERELNSSAVSFIQENNPDIFQSKKSNGFAGGLAWGIGAHFILDLICNGGFRSHPGFWKGSFLFGVIGSVGFSFLYSIRINQEYRFFPEEISHPRWLIAGGAGTTSLVASLGSALVRKLVQVKEYQDIASISAGVIGSIAIALIAIKVGDSLIFGTDSQTKKGPGHQKFFYIDEASVMRV